MKIIKYRKSVALGRFAIALGFVLVAAFLIYEGIYSDATLPRRIFYIATAVIGVSYFGRLLVVYAYTVIKNPTMLSYDAEKLHINGVEIPRKGINKVQVDTNIPTGILGIKTPAFTIIYNGQEKQHALTYYVLTSKDQNEIFHRLKEYVSNHKKAI